jgi:NADH-quinone oxidoreductase subunit B
VGHLDGGLRLDGWDVQQLRIVQGVDQVVPVDVYAPGCPPGPETLIHSILTLHEMIRRGEITRRRAETGAGAGVHLEEVRRLQAVGSK